jgi:SAM-dependent methyltransferase
MPREWLDVSQYSFNSLLLLERVQLSWLPGWLPETDLQIALRANPAVEWYLRHKCPQINDWLDQTMSVSHEAGSDSPTRIRQAEANVLTSMTDLLIYATDPAVYDAQPFLNWDATELLSLTDFTGKTVIDVGAGTGKLSLLVAEMACSVFAVEPVTNLRIYLKTKARARHINNVYTLDGLITDIPFPDRFADISMAGHVFGDDLEMEYNELARVTKPGGMLILCPGNNDVDNKTHKFLIEHNFEWSRFEEPRDGIKRKYWKTIA